MKRLEYYKTGHIKTLKNTNRVINEKIAGVNHHLDVTMSDGKTLQNNASNQRCNLKDVAPKDLKKNYN